MSKKEPKCVVCGKKVRGKPYRIYGNPVKPITIYICSEHKEFLGVLDLLKLPYTEPTEAYRIR